MCYDNNRGTSLVHGGAAMAFFATVISTLIKAAIVGLGAFAGIMAGKALRKRKNEKEK